MQFTHTRVGDLYQPVGETFTFEEIIDYKGALCFRALEQLPPFWPIGTRRPEEFKYLGNGVDDPDLRRRCECLTKVNFWLMYNQVLSIPRTLEYYAAVKEWQRIAPTAQEMLIRKAYKRQERWLGWQKLKDWSG